MAFVKEHSSAVLTQQHESKTKEELEELAINATLAGRIIRMRGPFIVIQDGKRADADLY